MSRLILTWQSFSRFRNETRLMQKKSKHIRQKKVQQAHLNTTSSYFYYKLNIKKDMILTKQKKN